MGRLTEAYDRLMRAWAADPSRGFLHRCQDRLFGIVPTHREAECMYGNLAGAAENCTVVVPAHQGWRANGMVFCCEEHAVRDQQEQIF